MSDPRREVVRIARAMGELGLSRGTSGNVSIRAGGDDGVAGAFLVTPTGMDYPSLTQDDVPLVRADGSSAGTRRPSSEWRIHRDVYARRPEVTAILHAHSPFAVALACGRRGVPPFHYAVARFGGNTVRCAPYAVYGSQELSDAALTALDGRTGCLLANHGMVVVAADPGRLLARALELEELCEQFWRTSQLGDPVLLTDEEMAAVHERFAGYGQQ